MHSLRHLSDQSLLAALSTLVAEDRRITARLLAHIAEVDARKLWTRAAYGSMHAYCMAELHFSESAAHKRVTAARAARRDRKSVV